MIRFVLVQVQVLDKQTYLYSKSTKDSLNSLLSSSTASMALAIAQIPS